MELDLEVICVDRLLLLPEDRRLIDRRHVVERLDGIDLESDPTNLAGRIE
jgi:hypothetical protein